MTRASRAGFTVIELLLVTTLLSLFMGAVYETIFTGLRVADATIEREDVRLQMAKAFELLTREASAAYNVDRSDDDRFQFDARVVDNDDDGDPENRTNINWRVSSGDLQRVQGGTTWTMIPDLSSCTFTYLDEEGDSTTDEDEVRVMQLSCSAVRSGETITMAASARLRNLDWDS